MSNKYSVDVPYVCNECGHECLGKETYSLISTMHVGSLPGIDPLYHFNPCPHCGSTHTYPKGLLDKVGFGGLFISQDRKDKWKEWDEYGPGGKPYDGNALNDF